MASGLVGLLVLCIAGAASAAPILFFDGPQGRGFDQAAALASGEPILENGPTYPPFALFADPPNPDLLSFGPPVIENFTASIFAPPAFTTVSWAVTNIGLDFDAFMGQPVPSNQQLFIVLPFPILPEAERPGVGFDLGDSNGNWVIVTLPDSVTGVNGYLPALPVGRPALGSTFTVRFKLQLNDPQYQLVPGGEALIVPQMQVIGVMAVIPEPATGLLITTGLVGLAWAARRRR